MIFSTEQYLLIALIFIWSGFVRTGIGFGGAALSLPLLLQVHNDPLVFLPIIGMHLLFFTSITLRTRLQNINWSFIQKSVGIMIVPKIIGILGLLTLPALWLTILVFSITLIYGLLWLLNISIRSNGKFVDILLLIFGGYVSGTSLIGAPLIVAVCVQHVERYQIRETLFVLWIILVFFKLSALLLAGVDIQLQLTLMLFPMAAIGHFFGLKAHAKLMHGNSRTFHQLMGAALIIISAVGLYRQFAN